MDTWQKSMPCTGGQTQGAWVVGWGSMLSFGVKCSRCDWAEWHGGQAASEVWWAAQIALVSN